MAALMFLILSQSAAPRESVFSMYPLDGPEYLPCDARIEYDRLCVAFLATGEAKFAAVPQSSPLSTQPAPINTSLVFHEFAGNWNNVNGSYLQTPGGFSPWFRTPQSNITCCTWSDRQAFMVPVVVLGNLWHMLWHTIPAYHWFTHLHLSELSASRLDVLVLPAQPISTYNSLGSIGWRLFLASIGFSDEDSERQINSQGSLLQRPGHFFCYHRAYVVGHDKFSLGNDPDVDTDYERVELFRRALHRQYHRQFPSYIFTSSHRVQVILRRMRGHGRNVANEPELRYGLDQLPMVDIVTFEELPFHEQLKRLMSSIGLCGIHGAGLAWAIVLRGFVIEIMPDGSWPTKYAYLNLAYALKVKYIQLQAQCINHACDVIVNVTTVRHAIEHQFSLRSMI